MLYLASWVTNRANHKLEGENLNLHQNASDAYHYARVYIENLQSQNPRQRSHAVQELGKLKAEQAVPHVIELLQTDVNTYVRSASAEALGHIGDPEAVFPLMDALQDSCSFVRRAAAISLGQMHAKQAQGALLRALEDPNFYVRRAAINAIGKLGIPDLGPILMNFLDTPDPRIQRTVVTALRRLRTYEAVPKMIEMLETYILAPSQRDLPVVKALVVALGDLRAKEAVSILMRVVRGYVGGRSLAANALGKIGDLKAGSVLVEALSDKSVNLQLSALKALGQLRYADALPSVRHFLESPDPRLRRMAVVTGGYLGQLGIAPILLALAKEDSSPLVRPAAVEALGRLGDAQVIPELLPLVEDMNAYLRAALAGTLCALDGDRADVKAALELLANDKVSHVALAAQHAMQNYDSEAKAQPASKEHGHMEPEQKPVSWLKRLLGKT